MDTTETTVTGTIRSYTDIRGRQQTAVDGPNGTWLITRKNDNDDYTVWKSDSLSTALRTRNAGRALERAAELAGIEI